MRGKLSEQEYSALLWVRTVNAMIDGVATRIVECGPGKVLAGFARRISKGTPVATIDTVDGLQKRLQS
jgi:[acyl-carrier-protein] S-malonyltransferase